MRKIKFANNEYYHIYNCGVDKRDVFYNKEIILLQFKNIEKYKKYIDVVTRESSKRKDLEKYFIE
ncbi:MAG: hypothetical protein KAS78_00065 [Candidatus Pacebacteria bacterium]|nr:hypothetical protein [Candidatus Paceibacterota bacterium]